MERVLCLCGYAVSCLRKYRENGRLSELNGQLNELATATFVAASFLLTSLSVDAGYGGVTVCRC